MHEIIRIADQLRRAYDGDAWCCPSLKRNLADVTPEIAETRPIPGAHSIWEIVHHLHAWVVEVDQTAAGLKTYESHTGDKDWPPVRETSPEAWALALNALENAVSSLEDTIRATPDDKLGEGERSLYLLFHGTVQHLLYHAGQIALLKKA